MKKLTLQHIDIVYLQHVHSEFPFMSLTGLAIKPYCSVHSFYTGLLSVRHSPSLLLTLVFTDKTLIQQSLNADWILYLVHCLHIPEVCTPPSSCVLGIYVIAVDMCYGTFLHNLFDITHRCAQQKKSQDHRYVNYSSIQLANDVYIFLELEDSLNSLITVKETDDVQLACEAPTCSKPITSKLLKCGFCSKQIHALCDPKTRCMKEKALNKVTYYCSFH